MGVLEIIKRNKKLTQGLGMPAEGSFFFFFFGKAACRFHACGFAREWAPLGVFFEDFV